jgi:hypothetical protein
MMERRNTTRVAVNAPCTFSIDGRDVHAHLVDLSDQGALFRVGSGTPPDVTTDDLGMEATFTLRSSKPARQYTGEMIRLFNRGPERFVALRFWKKYREVPTA